MYTPAKGSTTAGLASFVYYVAVHALIFYEYSNINYKCLDRLQSGLMYKHSREAGSTLEVW